MGDVAALTWPLSRPALLAPLRRDPAVVVQRCLFGPVDHEKTKAFLQEEMEKIYQKEKERWNFDFQAEHPLPPGRYPWERVGMRKDAGNGASKAKTASADSSIKETQMHITDFMRKRKSSSNQKETVTSLSKTRRRSST